MTGWLFLNIDGGEVNTVHQLPSAEQEGGYPRTGRTLRMSVADRHQPSSVTQSLAPAPAPGSQVERGERMRDKFYQGEERRG